MHVRNWTIDQLIGRTRPPSIPPNYLVSQAFYVEQRDRKRRAGFHSLPRSSLSGKSRQTSLSTQSRHVPWTHLHRLSEHSKRDLRNFLALQPQVFNYKLGNRLARAAVTLVLELLSGS